jgi:hypothetical protein
MNEGPFLKGESFFLWDEPGFHDANTGNEPCHRSPGTSNSLRNFYCATISPLNKLLGLYECCVVLGFL